MSLTGYVDYIHDNIVGGWARSDAPIQVVAYEGDVVIGESKADKKRRDTDDNVGYYITIDSPNFRYKILTGEIKFIAHCGDKKLLLPLFSGAKAELMNKYFGGVAVHKYSNIKKNNTWEIQKNRRIDGLKNALLFILMRDEEEIIGHNLIHHYNLGFRRFFILDNRSRDNSALRISNFRANHADAEVFYGYDYIVGHHQGSKMRALEAFATTYLGESEFNKPDWLFVVDADEFITICTADFENSSGGFEDILANENYKALVFHWVNCTSEVVYEDSSDIRDVYSEFPVTWNKMIPISKVAFRLNHKITTVTGSHMVYDFPYDISQICLMAEKGIFMLHFPDRSVAHLRRKILNGHEALSSMKHGKNVGFHWWNFYNEYQKRGDEYIREQLLLKIKNNQA